MSDSPDIHVRACIPSYGPMPIPTVISLVELTAEIHKDPPAGMKTIQFDIESSSNLPRGRQNLCERAIKAEATHILWIDADNVFPSMALHWLLDRKLPLVGANYPRRVAPHQPTSRAMDRTWQWSGRDYAGIQEVEFCGMGCFLMEVSVLKDIERPWFYQQYLPKVDQWTSDDVYFFWKLRNAGHKVFIDHNVSRAMKHVSEMKVDWDYARGWWEGAGIKNVDGGVSLEEHVILDEAPTILNTLDPGDIGEVR